MSVEAITWVLKDAPDVPPPLVSTLIGLANHAAPDGRNAYPSQPTLARYTRKDERTVRRDLAKLVRLGLIRRGDQRIVDHLPKDRRPVVYDLAMWRRGDLDGGTPTSGGTRKSARTPTSERGDAHVRTGGTPTSAKPSNEPSRTVSQSAQDRQAHRWLSTRYGLTDQESAEVVRQARHRAASTIENLVPYLNGMTEGDLADIVRAVMDGTRARAAPPPPVQPPLLHVLPDLPPPPDTRPAADVIADLRAEKGWRTAT